MKKTTSPDPDFRTSSYSPFSKSGDPTCVGVAITGAEVLVTNTKDPNRVLRFSRDEWDAFIKGVKNGEFNLR